MRVAVIITMFICLSCNVEDNVVVKEYDKAASYYSKDIDVCEKLSLQYLNSNFKSGNDAGVGKFAYLLAVINSRKEKYLKSADYFMMSHYYHMRAGDNKSASRSLIELAYVNNELHNYKFSKEDLKEVLSSAYIDEELTIKAYNYLIEAYLGLDEKDSALKVIESYIIPHFNDKVKTGFKYSNIGYLYLRAGNYDNALKYLNSSIELDNNNENASYCYNNLAYIYMERNQLDKALQLVNKSIACNQKYNTSYAYRTRASIYIKRKDYKLAEADLNSSLEYKPDYSELANGYEKIAKAYEEIGKSDQIGKYWKLNSLALKNQIRLENGHNEEAREVREAIFKHRKQQFSAQLTKKDQESIVIGIMSFAIILLVGYIFYDKMNRQKKDTIKNIDSILMRIRKERRK